MELNKNWKNNFEFCGNQKSFLCKISSHIISFKQRYFSKFFYLFLKIQYPEVVRIQLKLREKGGGSKGDYQWLRLYEMPEIFKKFQPQSICEYGGGASSGMFACLSAGEFVTVDESEFWQKLTLSVCGNLSKKMTPVLSRRVIAHKDGEDVCYYDINHNKYFDMVYVDGPDSSVEGKQVPCIDVELMWKSGIFPRVIVIDGRRMTLRRLLEREHNRYDLYQFKSALAINSGMADFGCRYHSILVRK